ncbi:MULTISPECIES: VOC family protein [unclassified Microcystis]|uniref:VOC family protein n=1 Tax=unclassified Microcystis TaxID=2643300 RepID=UPI00026205B4|nr:VOC family protein [Microcystis sp. T1-4]CCI33356.1 Glyoxalase/bleomycin resistance protein/dioxygenase [Microcystis sp. T1-4]
MTISPSLTTKKLKIGQLRKVHHIAFNVKDMEASRHFYGEILGLEELVGEKIPTTLKELVAQGKVANFITPDGTVIDLFWEPDLNPPDDNPEIAFTRANHLAFDIAPEGFDFALEVLQSQGIIIASGPVTRPTGRGVYFYDPDGFIVEIRCDPAS